MQDDPKFSESHNGQFQVMNFPEVAQELYAIKEKTKHLQSDDKGPMVISYLRDHMIDSDLVSRHGELVKIITSRATQVSSMEQLFVKFKGDSSLLTSFETYLANQLMKKTSRS
jgi:hypothetical protein